MADTRRVLYTPERVRLLFGRMQEELRELGARHIAEVARLHRQLEEVRAELAGVRAAFNELRAVSLARQAAETEITELRRQRELLRAFGAERDPATPLN
jgi:uncharacterized membrane protein